MGNREWKKAFSLLYQPPAPQRKKAFLERLEPPGLSTGEFLFSQLFYLRPWNWLLGVAIFAAGLFLMKNRLPQQIRLVSTLLPFAALSTVTELHRSARCRMEELDHQWWYAERDHDHNGICEYGSTDGTLIAAAWESGMDNGVRFDDTRMLKNEMEKAWSAM